MKRILFIVLLVATGLHIHANNSILFTEVCVANIDQTIDHSNNYGGWVEVYNAGDADVSLNGWYVSDDAMNLKKHRLTDQDVLRPGCYAPLFFDHNAADGEYGPDAAKQVRFKLNRKGGMLFLSQNGTNQDLSLSYPASVPRCSFARVSLEADEWQYCGTPTPGQTNAGPYAQDMLPAPKVNCDSRLFNEAFSVQVDIPEGATLRYTTDGSTPTLSNGQTSSDGLFPVSQTTVLRLRLFADDKLPSSVVTRTYIYKDRNYYLPIVAVTTDPDNLYDNMIGCYVDGKNGIQGRGSTGKSNLNMDWVRPVNFEYLTADGNMVINQEACFEVAGGWSRHFRPASFKLQAKKLYDGNSHFSFPVFAGKPHQEYKQLLIRNGGNNNRTYGGPRIMDAITQQVLTSSDFYVDAQEYQPAHVFVNGKYLAMMNVREPTGRFHGEANYGYDDDEMDAFEYSSGSYHQKGGTREAFDRMIQMSYEAESDEGYASIAELLDLDEFIRYMAAICYTGTGDWVLNSNNVKGYRLQDDGRFHFVFFDQDLTWEQTNNVEQLDNNEIIYLYRNLKQNKTFRRQFVMAYCILHGSIYTPERCRHIADSICALVKDALAFDSRYTATTYRKLQETMWEESHREARIQALMKSYALSDSIHVSINTNCPFARIQIDGMDVPFSLFDGVLFGPVSLSTNSAKGYRFIGWKDRQGKWLSHEEECLIAAGGNYTAVYDEQRDPDVSPLCINEVSAANDTYVNDYGKRADWIELFNRGQVPVDVSQWYFSDDGKNPSKYQIAASDETNTVIQPGEHLVVWCDGKPSITQLHLPFKLKNTDNSTLYLQSANGEWSDSLRYDSHSPKESVGRYPDGGNGIWTFYHPSIGNASIPTSYDRPVNSGVNALPPAIRDEELKNISYYTLSGIKTSRPLGSIYIKVSTSGAEQRKFLNSPR